jgi:choline dehydrogenase
MVGAGLGRLRAGARLSEDGPPYACCCSRPAVPDRNPWIHVPLGVGKLLNDPNATRGSSRPSRSRAGRPARLLAARQGAGRLERDQRHGLRLGRSAEFDRLGARGLRAGATRTAAVLRIAWSRCLHARRARPRRADPHHRPRAARPRPAVRRLRAGLHRGRHRADTATTTWSLRRRALPRADRARGRRWSAAVGYLRPARRRPNLASDRRAVRRVLFDGHAATGVSSSARRRAAGAQAAREVILCAGAIQSPQLLELSGIGDAGDPAALGIPVVRRWPRSART